MLHRLYILSCSLQKHGLVSHLSSIEEPQKVAVPHETFYDESFDLLTGKFKNEDKNGMNLMTLSASVDKASLNGATEPPYSPLNSRGTLWPAPHVLALDTLLSGRPACPDVPLSPVARPASRAPVRNGRLESRPNTSSRYDLARSRSSSSLVVESRPQSGMTVVESTCF